MRKVLWGCAFPGVRKVGCFKFLLLGVVYLWFVLMLVLFMSAVSVLFVLSCSTSFVFVCCCSSDCVGVSGIGVPVSSACRVRVLV